VLDSSRFAATSPDERRKFLFDLLHVDTSHTAIAGLLASADVPTPIVDEILPILRGGFEGAEKYADTKTTEARGAWKAVTGETYGDKKAEDWKPDNIVDIVGVEKDLADKVDALPGLEKDHSDALKRLGVAESRAAAQSNPELVTARETLPGWRERLATGQKRESDLRAELQRLEARQVLTLKCPCCEEPLVLIGNELSPYEDHAATNTDDKRREVRETLDACVSGIHKIERIIKDAERLIANAEGDVVDVQALRDEVKRLDTDIGKARLARETLELHRRDAAKAKSQVADAAKFHAAVQAWKLCAEQLSPSGIQATLLAQALGPINAQLTAASDLTEWGRVEILADMTITYAGKMYVLCSESERWRADAMIADALAKLSGLKVMLLDRFDVLDHPGRSAALNWLIDVAPAYDTILVGATLKTAPNIESVNTIWLDDASTGRKAA